MLTSLCVCRSWQVKASHYILSAGCAETLAPHLEEGVCLHTPAGCRVHVK